MPVAAWMDCPVRSVSVTLPLDTVSAIGVALVGVRRAALGSVEITTFAGDGRRVLRW